MKLGGAAGPGRCRDGWEQPPTKPGCARTARWRGFGERGGVEYARNQREYLLRKVNRLQSRGYGSGAVRTCSVVLGQGTSGPACGCRSGRPR